MNNYAEIVEILAKGVDLRAIAIEIAKAQPSAFVNAHKRLEKKTRRRKNAAKEDLIIFGNDHD